MLTAAQIAAFQQNGVLVGLPALSPAQAAAMRRHLRHRETAAVLLRALAVHPALLGVARDLLGPDLLVRNVDVFIKAPRSPQHTDWHVDTHVPPAQAAHLLNLWVALTPSTPESGCLEYLPGHHHRPLPEEPTDLDALTLTSAAQARLDLRHTVLGVLAVGALAVHAFRTPHRSGPNRTASPRIGVVVRLFSAAASPEAAGCGQAVLACGHPGAWAAHLRPEAPVGWNLQIP